MIDNKLRQELSRHIRNMNYEVHEQGFYVPNAHLNVGGYFSHNVFHRDGTDEGWITDPNIVVNEGLDHVLDVVLGGGTQVDPWYIALFEGDATPIASWTAANFTSNSTESTAYDESTRVEYVPAAASSQSITNSANTADFTMNATKTIYGAGMLSASAKSATTGTLFASARLSSSRDVIATDQLSIIYQVDAADA